MAYEDLTAQERQLLDDFMAMIRPWAGELARLHNRGAAVYSQYWANISTIMDKLEGTDEIPNKTGNAGASTLTKTQTGTILTWVESVATINSEANRQLMAIAAGGPNLASG